MKKGFCLLNQGSKKGREHNEKDRANTNGSSYSSQCRQYESWLGFHILYTKSGTSLEGRAKWKEIFGKTPANWKTST